MIKITYKNLKIERLNVFALLIASALIVIYLFIANNVAINNYRKTSLQKYIDGLRMEIRTLNLELTDKRSIGFLKKAAQNLNLVVNESIQYVKISGPVAKNE
ncbi:MAG: hypothetical protein HYV51_02520 [Parcubacteria group bacterium]|nr:hypothetical protein [Parcubacteria group bacterium]